MKTERPPYTLYGFWYCEIKPKIEEIKPKIFSIRKNIRKTIKQLQCKHNRSYQFFPEEVWLKSGIVRENKMSHGAKMTCCMDCGKVWASNYAE